MASQHDLYFAEYAIKKGFSTTAKVQESFDILSRLKSEAGIDDSLSGVMLIKGYVSEKNVEEIRALMEKDGIVVKADVPAPAPAQAPVPAPANAPDRSAPPAEAAEDAKLRFHFDSAKQKEDSGDFAGAIVVMNQARAYDPDRSRIDGMIAGLRKKARPAELDGRYRRYKDEVNEKAKAQDFEGAIKTAGLARDFAADAAEMESALAKLKEAALKKRERDAWNLAVAGDIKEALKTIESALWYAGAEAVKKIIAELNQSADMKQSTSRYLAMAESYQKKGNLQAALDIYGRLARVLPDMRDLQLKMDGLKKEAFDLLMVEARKKEWIGDFDAAMEACIRARQYTRAVDSVDRKIAVLRKKAEYSRKFRELKEDGVAKIGRGDLEGGLKSLKEALEFADNRDEFRSFMDGLVAGKYESLVRDVAARERRGDLEGAMAAAKEAQVFAPAAKADEARTVVQNLAEKIAAAERRDKFERILKEADSLLEAGDARKAIDRMKAARAFAENPSAVDERIERVASEQFEKGISEARDLGKAGKLQDALKRSEALVQWAKGREETLKHAIAGFKAGIERMQKEEEFLARVRAAGEFLRKGRIKQALDAYESASEWEEKRTEMRANIDEVFADEYAKATSAAAALGSAGSYAEAAETVRKALAWARGKETEIEKLASGYEALDAESRKKRAFEEAAAGAELLMKSGDFRGGIRKLKEARAFETNPGETDRMISAAGRTCLEGMADRAGRLIAEGKLDDAEPVISEAAAWAAELGLEFSERLSNLERGMASARKSSKYLMLKAEAEKFYSENSVKKAVRKLEEAGKIAENPSEITVRIEQIKRESLDKHLADVERLTREEDYKWAIVSCELAKEYASGPDLADVEKRIEQLRGFTKSKERKDAFEKIRTEALEYREDGQLGRAIDCYREARGLAESPSAVDEEIEGWKRDEVRNLLGAASDLLAGRRYAAAREAASKAAEWDAGMESSEMLSAIKAEEESRDRSRKLEGALAHAEEFLNAGDPWKAVDALNAIRDSAPADFDVEGRIRSIVDGQYESRVRESRSAMRAGEFEKAMRLAESAREFAGERGQEFEGELRELRGEIEKKKRKARIEELKAWAAEAIADGSIRQAANLLSEAAKISDSPREIEVEIERIFSAELEKVFAHADSLGKEGRYADAEEALEKARQWAVGREEDLDAAVARFREAKSSFEEETQFRKIVTEAEERYSKGDSAGAIESLRFALSYASRKGEIEERIGQISDATFEKWIEESRVREGAGMLAEALESCEMAREWAGRRAPELEARIADLRASSDARRKNERWRAIESDVRARIETQDVEGAVDILEKEIEIAPDPAEVRTLIGQLRQREYETGVLKARKIAAEGDMEKAVASLEKVRKWSVGREKEYDDELMALGRSAEAGKRHGAFKKLEAQADEAEKTGNVGEAMKLLDLARVYAEDASVIESRIRRLFDRTLDEYMKDASACEDRMDMEGAVKALRAAADWAGTRAPRMISGDIDRLSALMRMEKGSDRLARMNVVTRALLAEEKVVEAAGRYMINLETAGEDEGVRGKMEEIVGRHLARYSEAARNALSASDWSQSLSLVGKAEKIMAILPAPSGQLKSAFESASALRRDSEFLRCRSKAMESAREGDIKVALGFCEEAKVYADDPEVLETAMISLVDSAFSNWSAEAGKRRDSGEWEAARNALKNISSLFDLHENITRNIYANKERIVAELKEAEFKHRLGEAASEEMKGNLLRSVEILRAASAFADDSAMIESEIQRVQLALFDKFNVDLRKVEADEGVEGAIRFCKAALDYFPEVDVVKQKLKDYSDRWKLKERRKLFVQYDRGATSAISRGDIPTAVENYLAAAEYSTDPEAIRVKIAALIDPVVAEVVKKAEERRSAGDLAGAIAMCEEAFAKFPSSRVLQEKIIALRKQKIDATTLFRTADVAKAAAAEKWKSVIRDRKERRELEVADGKESILKHVWETDEFKVGELFPGGKPPEEPKPQPVSPEPAIAVPLHEETESRPSSEALSLEEGGEAGTPGEEAGAAYAESGAAEPAGIEEAKKETAPAEEPAHALELEETPAESSLDETSMPQRFEEAAEEPEAAPEEPAVEPAEREEEAAEIESAAAPVEADYSSVETPAEGMETAQSPAAVADVEAPDEEPEPAARAFAADASSAETPAEGIEPGIEPAAVDESFAKTPAEGIKAGALEPDTTEIALARRDDEGRGVLPAPEPAETQAPASPMQEPEEPASALPGEVAVLPEPSPPEIAAIKAPDADQELQRRKKVLEIAKRLTKLKKRRTADVERKKQESATETPIAAPGEEAQPEKEIPPETVPEAMEEAVAKTTPAGPVFNEVPAPVAEPGAEAAGDLNEETIGLGENLMMKEYLESAPQKPPEAAQKLVEAMVPAMENDNYASQEEAPSQQEYKEIPITEDDEQVPDRLEGVIHAVASEPESEPVAASAKDAEDDGTPLYSAREETESAGKAPMEEAAPAACEPAVPVIEEDVQGKAEPQAEEAAASVPAEPQAAAAGEDEESGPGEVPASTGDGDEGGEEPAEGMGKESQEPVEREEAGIEGAQPDEAEGGEAEPDAAAVQPVAEAKDAVSPAKKKEPKIPVKCANPACGFMLKVPLAHAGKAGRCPKCGKQVKVPMVKGMIRCAACGKVAQAKGGAKVKGKPVCAECVAKIKARKAR